MKEARVPHLRRTARMLGLLCLAAVVALAAIVGWRAIFIVDETQVALVRTFCRASEPPVAQAGFCLKWPWETVRHVDRRVRVLPLDPREKLTRNHESIVVQPRVCWRVSSEAAESFVRSVGDSASAEPLLADLVWRRLDRELAERPLTDWLNPAGDREPTTEPPLVTITAKVTQACQQEAFARFGIDLLDIQLQQFCRPERMKRDLLRLAQAEQRRQIDRKSQEVDLLQARLAADARRQVDRILSEADDQGERMRADGRREAQRLEGEARAISASLTDYLVILERYRKLIPAGGTVESQPETGGVPVDASRPSAPKTQSAPTGRAPTPGSAPAPRSGKH